jgi:phosphinothricin acetyltransferase
MTARPLRNIGGPRGSPAAATEEIKIRHANESDLPDIIEIHNAAIASRISTAQLEPVNLDSRREWFRAHSSTQYPIWVAESEGAIAGWISFNEFLQRSAYRGTVELSVYVCEQFRRRGIATKLLQEAIARGPQLRMHSLVGLIFGHNQPSIALFRAAGFECWGLLPRIARVDQIPRDLTIFGRHL